MCSYNNYYSHDFLEYLTPRRPGFYSETRELKLSTQRLGFFSRAEQIIARTATRFSSFLELGRVPCLPIKVDFLSFDEIFGGVMVDGFMRPCSR